MTFLAQWILVFVALFVTDILWAFYIDAVKDAIPLKSAMWAALMFGVGTIGVISYVTNPWLVLPAFLGCFFGTYTGVWWNNRRKK